MTFEELTLALFAACNSIRIFAYVPQIYKAATDENGAAAISCTTWFLFLVAHLSTIAYALVNQSDWGLAACFAANAACCAAILAITVSKRRAAAATLLEEGSRASEDFDDDSRSSANGGCFSTNNLRIGNVLS